jgi:hypothetical protein
MASSIPINIRNNLDRATAGPSLKPFKKPKIRVGAWTSKAVAISLITSFVKTDSFLALGGLLMRSGSGGLKPSAMAGRPSVARLM